MDFMVGKNIKGYLRDHGITQAFVSKKTGIPAPVLSERLNGKSSITANELYAIADALGVPLETFRKPFIDEGIKTA